MSENNPLSRKFLSELNKYFKHILQIFKLFFHLLLRVVKQHIFICVLKLVVRHDEVVDFLLHEKPFMTHVVLTGRNAKDELIEAADLVTEMSLIKHPFRDGIKAQKGIEF